MSVMGMLQQLTVVKENAPAAAGRTVNIPRRDCRTKIADCRSERPYKSEHTEREDHAERAAQRGGRVAS